MDIQSARGGALPMAGRSAETASAGGDLLRCGLRPTAADPDAGAR